MNRHFRLPEEKKYFMLPAMPTPNGRIHLGHIAGPYLKLDVIKRKVKRNNGTVYICAGSDVYDSYVELKAEQMNISTDDVSNHFHELMKKDFEALNIEFDLFINPLDESLKEEYKLFVQNFLQNLVNAGAVEEREEMFPYDPVNKRYLSGCWIKGLCPNCKQAAASYFCENCGMHYRPQDIFDCVNYPDAIEIQSKSLYIKLDKNGMVENAARVQNGKYKHIAERFIELQGPYTRITTPQRIGVPFPVSGVDDQMIFTYPVAGFFFPIFCGNILKNKKGFDKNPFETDSGFITCATFGIDNLLPYLAAVYGAASALPTYRDFDNLIGNYFYYLNGEKFSTSRLHVIWSSDIVELAGIQSDVVRYYLCKVNPEFDVQNFDTTEFINTIKNELYLGMNNLVKEAASHLEPWKNYPVDDFIFQAMENEILKQNENLVHGNFNLAGFLLPIDEWVKFFRSFDDKQKAQYSYWWLKTLAYLCYPVMPEFSIALWDKMSTEKEILTTSFFVEETPVSCDMNDLLFKEVTTDAINKSMPGKKAYA